MIKKFNEFLEIDEAFNAPDKSFTDYLPGGEGRYKKKCEEAEAKYFNSANIKFANKLKTCKSMQDLINLSREIAEYGFPYPIAGMLTNGATPMSAAEKDIKWLSADREYEETVADLIKFYEKSNNSAEVDSVSDTYRISWKWWCANIVRVLFFWKSPFDDNAIEHTKLVELIKQYSPSIPQRNNLKREY